MLDAHKLVGQTVDRYLVTEHIAEGGMANVYLATDQELQRQVALKIMLPELARDQQFVERFRREARVVAQLDHPNIVQVYGTGFTATQQPYIAMQYINGRSLAQTLHLLAKKQRTIPTIDALLIIRQIAQALAVAHAANIIHRDIKPSNILIRPDQTPVLVDLGIAAVQTNTRLTNTGSLLGTPHYMSPEQIKGETVNGRSDIYSLGIILYEILSGQPPFNMPSTMAILHSHVYEKPTPLDRIRPTLAAETKSLVATCLQKEPAQRFTATDMLPAIDAALQAEGQRSAFIESPPSSGSFTPTSQHHPQTAAKPKWLYSIGAVLLLGLLSLVAFQLFPSDTAEAPSIASPTVALASATSSENNEKTAVSAVSAATSTISPTNTPAPPTATVAPTNTPLPATPTPSSTPHFGPETIIIAQSPLGTPIEMVRFGTGSNKLLFVGGIHAGYAPSTVTLAQQAVEHFSNNPQEVPTSATIYIVTSANPDSPLALGETRGRLNSNGVDLNRNWDCLWTQDATVLGNLRRGSGGTAPFSEPEVRGLADFILEQRPVAAIFWVARASKGLASPGSCDTRTAVSGSLAQTYGIAANYEIGDFEQRFNQILNGDATNWLDQEGIPAAAVLIKEYGRVDWEDNLAGIRAVVQRYGN